MLTWILLGIFLFGFGACLGSFASALQHRIKTGRGDMLTGRSFCPGCERTLLWYHMIPIVSWLALGGKCGHCGRKIGIRYITLELVFGIIITTVGIVVLRAHLVGPLMFGILLMILFTILFLAIYDALYQEVPDAVVVGMTLIAFLYLVADIYYPGLFVHFHPIFEISFIESLIAGVAFYLFFAAQNILAGIVYFSREGQLRRLPRFFLGFLFLPFWWTTKIWIGEAKADTLFPLLDDYDDVPCWVGGGDLRYALFLGLTSGLYVGSVSLIIGYIIGGVFGFVLLLRGERDRYIALIPFLASGWVLAMVFISII